ncbi:MAG: UDP-N-acetylmuramate dehydrogenase [Candidatus Colwellbacteria bacterium]|nr:UDP-N-acetylmuramate dehydrogenase [Candidatus Colwellbacteria bacterium]
MALSIKENVSLKEYSTMRVGGPARYLATILTARELVEALSFAKAKDLPVFVVGGGSNVIFGDDGYPGLVIACRIKGFEVLRETDNHTFIKVGAGEVWDDVALKSVEMGLSGIEAMSIVPGLVGAAPIHNIGCYGQEVSETILELNAYDTKEGRTVTFENKDCKFGYRTSRFEKEDKGRYVIVDVTFRLNRTSMKPPFYKDVEQYFEEQGVKEYSPEKVREAVIAIRRRKLPDPNEIPNTGSFFRNVVVSMKEFDDMVKRVPSLNETPEGWPQPPRWFLPDGKVKVASARLVELAGFSSYEDKETGMATWPKQNLVLINKNAKSARDVIMFRDKIAKAVKDKFGIDLEDEVEIVR